MESKAQNTGQSYIRTEQMQDPSCLPWIKLLLFRIQELVLVKCRLEVDANDL